MLHTFDSISHLKEKSKTNIFIYVYVILIQYSVANNRLSQFICDPCYIDSKVARLSLCADYNQIIHCKRLLPRIHRTDKVLFMSSVLSTR